MATCSYCGTTILFGGKREGDYRFCNDTCLANGYVLKVANEIPAELVERRAAEVHSGACPKCGKAGPVDVQTHYTIWSALLLTSWKSNPEICCRSCGVKSKLGGMAFSLVLGWWGIPWGILITPVQVTRNFVGLFSGPDAGKPSEKLRNIMKVELGARLIETQQKLQQQGGASPE